jgi:hypothetical protein
MSHADDPFALPSTDPPARVRPMPPSVYLYINASKPVPLCISHAVKRRRRGTDVEMMDGARARSGGCVDCNDG